MCPSWVRTDMADRRTNRFVEEAGLDGDGLEAAYEEVTRVLPAGRPDEPHEVAEAIDWQATGPEPQRHPAERADQSSSQTAEMFRGE